MRDIFPIIKRIVLYIFLTGATILMSFPLFWMISSSLKTLEETNSAGIIWLPESPTLAAYISVFQNEAFLRSYFNTVFYTTLSLVGTLISIAVVAYAFSRIEWPGRELVFFLMLSTMLIPPQALIVPQYVFFNKLKWVGTFNPIIIPGFFAGGAAMVFLLRQSMSQIPKELDESAFVDGANHIQIFWEVVMPLIKAPLATVATFLFVGLWNSLLAPLM
jgi:ABC-type glycerol-3-phosphate transport system permease component